MSSELENLLRTTLAAKARAVDEGDLQHTPESLINRLQTHRTGSSPARGGGARRRSGSLTSRSWLPLLAVAAVAIIVAGTAVVSTRLGSDPDPGASLSEPLPSTSTSLTAPESESPTPVTEAPTPRAPLLGLGAEAPGSEVPWDQVGTGWTLAGWSAVASPLDVDRHGVDQPTTIYLVNPAGGRYLIAQFSVTTYLADWSGDGRRALILGHSGDFSTLTELDLTSGELRTVPLAKGTTVRLVQYTKPNGRAILLDSSIAGRDPVLARIDTSGAIQKTYPTLDQTALAPLAAIYTADGTRLVRPAEHGMALIGNDGSPIRDMPAPTGSERCWPTRMWDEAQVLATCMTSAYGYGLWLFPLNGDEPSPLASPTTAGGVTYEPSGAWSVGPRVFVNTQLGCGGGVVSELDADGDLVPVSPPGLAPDHPAMIIASANGRLTIVHNPGCMGDGYALALYDPAANTVTPVLGPGANGGSLIRAVAFALDR